jgi:uncharacterized protein YjbJ (UPF0337 family)
MVETKATPARPASLRNNPKQDNPKPAMNTLTIKGDWNIAKGKLKQKYAKLTDNDLRYVDGQEDELIGRLQKVTGAKREELERFLKDENNYR